MKMMHRNWLSMAAAVLLVSQLTSAMAQQYFSTHVDADSNI